MPPLSIQMYPSQESHLSHNPHNPLSRQSSVPCRSCRRRISCRRPWCRAWICSRCRSAQLCGRSCRCGHRRYNPENTHHPVLYRLNDQYQNPQMSVQGNRLQLYTQQLFSHLYTNMFFLLSILQKSPLYESIDFAERHLEQCNK